MIRVSIIVPVYNTEKYLNKCIDSLLSQTEKNIEIILINDGSNDSSENIIKAYKDKRIKYFSKSNEGIGKTRNLGIDKAKGKYLMFTDSDDYIANNCVEKMLAKAEKNHCDLVISDFYKDFGDHLSEVIIPSFVDSSLKDNPEILNNINLGPCNKLYKRELIGQTRFVENLKYEDVTFVIEVLKNAKKIGKVNNFLSYYVIHSNSETTTRDKRIFDMLEVVKKMHEILNENCYQKALLDLSVTVLLDYVIQTRYIKDRKVRHSFINAAFSYLNSIDSSWRNCESLHKLHFLQRIVKKSRLLTYFYCDIIGKKYR